LVFLLDQGRAGQQEPELIPAGHFLEGSPLPGLPDLSPWGDLPGFGLQISLLLYIVFGGICQDGKLQILTKFRTCPFAEGPLPAVFG